MLDIYLSLIVIKYRESFMSKKRKSSLFAAVGALALLGCASTVGAVPIYTQTPQGSYTTNVLGGSSWSGFTTQVLAQHTYTQGLDFSNLAILQSHDAVWVDQELSNTLSGSEISTLTNYVSGGGKLLMFGENTSWNAWNQSLMAIVGGGFTDDCSWSVGTPLISNTLTAGIAGVENGCGSMLTNAGSPTMLFSNNLAGLYNIGAGDALVILDSNWNDDSYIQHNDNIVFAQNVINWLGEGGGCGNNCQSVPEPATLALMALGLAGFGFRRKKQV